jgi:dihydroneopterin aldolase/2-amino-4-hydroxy-6-hydroxymethyldihydropteridine diphosphokinase
MFFLRKEGKMDSIKIKRLEVFANHGAMPEENVLGQKFLISVEMFCNVRKAGQTDNLEQTINYAQVASFLKQETENHMFHLIETLAEYLAREILLKFSMVEQVTIEVEKPWAPIMMPLETVSVVVARGWHKSYLSIGSNMGDKKAHLDLAVKRLGEDLETVVEKVSSYQITSPVGGVEQEDFLNGAVCIRTLRTPCELLELIDQIEQEQKRERKIHWGPRTIDVDILLYDEEVIQRENLMIPHVEMQNRMFVLDPMCEIAPYARHPLEGANMLQLRETLQKKEATH